MGKGVAITGFVFGIVGIVLTLFAGLFLSFIAFPISIIGLVMAIIGGKKLKKNFQSTGMATAGVVIGIIAVAITSCTFFAFIVRFFI